MAHNRIRITGARVTPVAFADPPLLNTVGVHQPYALRAVIQLDTDAGLTGLGETYADTVHAAPDDVDELQRILSAGRAVLADALVH